MSCAAALHPLGADSEIVEGAWVQIERVKVCYDTSTGPMTELIDTCIQILDCGPEQ